MRAHHMLLVTVTVLGMSVLSTATSTYAAASPGDNAMTDQQRIVSQFATAFLHDDHAGIAANTTPDITWTIPGTSKVSGLTSGRDGVIGLADTFTDYEVHITLRAMTFGLDTVAVELHDTGNHNGQVLDQDVVNVLTIRDGKIASVTEHLADISSFDAYLA
jgi:ketosteroid isomerase-like protein